MGQEISQPKDKSNNIGRRQQQHQKQQQQSQHNKHQYHQPNFTSNNEKYTKRNSSASTTTLTSSNNSSEDELQRQQLQLELKLQQQQRPKYNTPKQSNSSTPTSYEKQKLTKKLSLISNISSTSDYQSTSVSSIATSSPTHSLFYDKLQKHQHQRKSAQSTDSGIYYTSCHCSTSSAASSCDSTAESAISSSNKSLDKQKNYLNHHLYIKSYLDILEEDEKARAHFKPARPGIRNYTPKILSDSSAVTTLASTCAPTVSSINQTNTKLRSSTAVKGKDDPWI